MSDIYRDPISGDISLGGTKQIRLTIDDEETLQRLKSRLSRWAGEWFADRTLGVPYRAQILVKNPDLDIIRSILRSEIAADPGVSEVQSLAVSVDPVTRHMTATFTAVSQLTGSALAAVADMGAIVNDSGEYLELDDGELILP